MKYGDLFNFDPIDFAVDITNADVPHRDLTGRWVIGPDLASGLSRLIPDDPLSPELRPGLISGRLGTGKSHALSALCAVAEGTGQVDDPPPAPAAEALARLAGRYHVVRISVGRSALTAIDLAADAVSRRLSQLGLEDFSSRNDTGEADLWAEMTAAHADAFPDRGLLVAVDELGEYPDARPPESVAEDLAALLALAQRPLARRPLIIAAVTLWRDALSSDVQSDWTCLPVTTDDLRVVVSKRLIPKTDEEQRDKIRQIMKRYQLFCEDVADQMDRYVELFPVHPDFPQVVATANDPAPLLQTLSAAISKIVDQRLPSDLQMLLIFDTCGTEDYEARILAHADQISTATLNRFYYEALKRAMECTYDTYVANFRVWHHELEWHEHNVTRSGYVIFGGPGDLPNAVTRRDFYLFFLPFSEMPRFRDDRAPDTLYIALKRDDSELDTALSRYAAALDLAVSAGGVARSIYEIRANEYLDQMLQWLNAHTGVAFDLTYRGRSRTLLRWAGGRNIRELSKIPPDDQISFKEMIDTIAAICLAPHFTAQAPAYPYFPILITSADRERAAQEAIRWIAADTRTRQAAAVLSALELITDDELDPFHSRYAQAVRQQLDEADKSGDGMLRRGDILERTNAGELMAPESMRLEPEWVLVILSALIYSGDIILVLPNRRLDATHLLDLAARPFRELLAFNHIERFTGWNIPAIREVFLLLGVSPGMAQLIAQGKVEPVERLRERAEAIIGEVRMGRRYLGGGLPFWGESLLEPETRSQTEAQIDAVSRFVEPLTSLTTSEDFKGFRIDAREMRACREGLEALRGLIELGRLADDLSGLAAYLAAAYAATPEGDDWIYRMEMLRDEVREGMRDPASRADAGFMGGVRRRMDGLREEYVNRYIAAHQETRLDPVQAERKAAIFSGNRFKRLRRLAELPVMPSGELDDFIATADRLVPCESLTPDAMRHSAVCPYCGFKADPTRPHRPAAEVLDELGDRLEIMLGTWSRILIDCLQEPTAAGKRKALPNTEQAPLDDLIESGKLPIFISEEFIRICGTVTRHLARVPLSAEKIRAALTDGGAMVSIQSLRERFDALLTETAGDLDPETVRIEVR